jgi:hypothetical protein
LHNARPVIVSGLTTLDRYCGNDKLMV